jgi:aspartate/tyrosine/aromatic aminotransferase
VNRYLRTRVKAIYVVKSMVETKADGAPKLHAKELRRNGEKGTDLKRKRLSSPHWVVHKSIVNMRGMNVNLHRLRLVPINR